MERQLLDYNNITQRRMDRLFGKELSNLLEQVHLNKQRPAARITSKSTRPLAADQNPKLIHKKAEKVSTSAHHESKPMKMQQVEDKENIEPSKNEQLVPEYFDECFQFMLQQESKSYFLTNYINEQPEINDKMRGILLQWLIQLHYKFKMFPETIFVVSMILDKYLSVKAVNKENLQLLGAAAFFVAAKYEETYQIPEIDDLVHFSAKAFTKQELIKMEADILETLEFDLIMTTSYRFFEPLAKISNMDVKNYHLAQYVLELSLLDVKFLEYKPSLMASSAIYLINKIRKRSEAWSDLMMAATGYDQKDLKGCARQLCYLLQRADDLPNTKSLKKKFSSVQYHEVTRIKLERKKQ